MEHNADFTETRGKLFLTGKEPSALTFILQSQGKTRAVRGMTPSERRSEILRLLCKRRHETAINLATEFGVSERTIRNDLVILSCYYPIQVTRGRYGGGAHLPEWFHLENRMLSPKQEILLQKLKTALDGEELQIMNSILAQFALYWEYRRFTDFRPDPCKQNIRQRDTSADERPSGRRAEATLEDAPRPPVRAVIPHQRRPRKVQSGAHPSTKQPVAGCFALRLVYPARPSSAI